MADYWRVVIIHVQNQLADETEAFSADCSSGPQSSGSGQSMDQGSALYLIVISFYLEAKSNRRKSGPNVVIGTCLLQVTWPPVVVQCHPIGRWTWSVTNFIVGSFEQIETLDAAIIALEWAFKSNCQVSQRVISTNKMRFNSSPSLLLKISIGTKDPPVS